MGLAADMRGRTATRVAASTLADFASGVLAACGLPAHDAGAAAALIVEADFTGVPTHGVFRLPEYVVAFEKGLVNPNPSIRVERHGAVAHVDGDNGLGHLAVAEAARAAITIARETGVGWVGTHHSNHAGAGSVYAALPPAQGMVGIYAAVSGANHMAPWGAAEPLLGTNPLAIGIPAGDDAPFLIDIATSVGSFGAIKARALRGEAIPAGWMIDRRDGAPLTDPARIAEGLLAPIGDHKGSGLAMAIGLLAGVMNGAAFGREVRRFDEAATAPANAGQTVIAVDPARFMPRDLFEAAVARHLADVAAAKPLARGARVRWPGERRAALRADHLAHGVPIEPGLLERLNALGARLGVPALGPFDRDEN
ncbi:Ldh family oxidoreductase [Bosea sp. 117]|uniref:Ldh family oxidoreductase n=1 Tax=Bosea sp. 117 TaxID=1125973 RepID=UPI00068EFD15|nr:Ldh family oxidoreductase [Bosea sp. 117]